MSCDPYIIKPFVLSPITEQFLGHLPSFIFLYNCHHLPILFHVCACLVILCCLSIHII